MNLLSQNRFKKYSFYAIGEIFLVVVGILIALQLNNLNENRKTNEKEYKYLLALESELKNNLLAIEFERKELHNSLDSQRLLIRILNSKMDTINDVRFSKIIHSAFRSEISLNYKNGVFNELLNSGGLNILSNDSIRVMITSWEGIMIGVRQQEAEALTCRNRVTSLLVDNGDFKRIMDDNGVSDLVKMEISKNESNKELLKNKRFKNLITLYIVLGSVLDGREYSLLEVEINQLLRLVEKDIEAKG